MQIQSTKLHVPVCCKVQPRGSSTKWKLSSSCKDARVASTEEEAVLGCKYCVTLLQVLRGKQSKVCILGWDVRRQQRGERIALPPNCSSYYFPKYSSAGSTVTQVHKTCATSTKTTLPSVLLPLQVYEPRSGHSFSPFSFSCRCGRGA